MKSFFTNSYRHIQRYHEIINVFTKHGIGHLLELTGLRNALRLPWKNRTVKEAPLGIAERLRMVLEELGPTFIKLGQVLSTRSDLLPAVYISQLEMLQDRVIPVDFAKIREMLRKELGLPVEKVFASFNPVPLASASIGQVHEAFLLSGEHVVVKVQRAGLRKLVETDLEILYDVAGIIESRTEWGKLYKVQSLINEFARIIQDELDYIIEAKNAERFRENFRGDPTVLFPGVFWEYTTQKVLVLDYLTGIKITAAAELEQAGINKPETAKKIADAFFKQLLIDGFFHADPHPGNIAVAGNGVIIFMDFGMVGRLEGWIKERLGTILLGIIRKDLNSILRVLNEFADEPSKDTRRNLKRELYYLLDKYYNRPLQEIKISSAFRELLALSANFRIRIPQELVSIARCLILLENIIQRLDPKTSLIELAKPFGPRLLMARFAPRNAGKAILEYLLELTVLAANLPRQLTDLFQMAADGEIKIILEHHNFDNFVARLTILGNRLAFSLIVASIIIGSSLITLKSSESLLGRFPIAEAGFIVAVLMGIWLLISIIKSGRI